MANEPTPDNQSPAEAQVAPSASGMRGHVGRILGWASATRLRMVLAGSMGLFLLAGTFAAWSYLARLAVEPKKRVTLQMALDALDNRNLEEAKSLVARLQQNPEAAQQFGGSLFVLGAVKAYQAEAEWSPARRRAMHLVAARYLQKSQAMGLPPDRERQTNFMLGKSLVRGNQPTTGITSLLKAFDDDPSPNTEIHLLLTEAYLSLPDPDPSSALDHNQRLLSSDSLDPSNKTEAIITQADILGKLLKFEEASTLANSLKGHPDSGPQVLGLSGRLAVAEATQLPEGSPRKSKLIEQAVVDLQEAQRQDPLRGDLTRQAMYWIGKCYELQQKSEAAIEQYDKIGKLFGDSAESLVSTLSKADLALAAGRADTALEGYRAVLDAAGDPITYHNHLLSLSSLRKRLMSAHTRLNHGQHFQQALSLANQFPPVFDLVEVTELRAVTHKAWGEAKLQEAEQVHRRQAEELIKTGRYQLRAAGRAFESLARFRFATRKFTADLWETAENYYQGHSFSQTARILGEYLHHDPSKHQALVLLRMGQSLLASGQTDNAIAALEECIEMHPGDGSVYQDRLECVRAYMEKGNTTKAYDLLITNLSGDNLTPRSPEWRYTLFSLGEFLHDAGRYDEAVTKLDEAVTRYPDAPQTLLARYNIARSFHSASEHPGKISREAKTESERQKNRKLRDEYLESSLQNYLKVQRIISIDGHGARSELERTLLRNFYMMQGSVLFQLKRFQEARKAYANVSTLYQNEPFVLESFVHIANCWRRLNQPVNARQTIEQAKLVLDRLPQDTDFQIATNFSRKTWKQLLNEMSKW